MGRKRGRWLRVTGWTTGLLLLAAVLFLLSKSEFIGTLRDTGWDYQLARHLEVELLPLWPDDMDEKLKGKPSWYVATAKWLCRKKIFGVNIGPVERTYRPKLDPGEPAIDVGTTPYGVMLYEAGVNYAFDTGDYQVQLKELIDGGYLPFKHIEDVFDTDGYIYGESGKHVMIYSGSWKPWAEGDLQTMLDLAHKNMTLEWFAEGYAKELIANNMREQPVQSFMELDPYTQFWKNLYTGEPMREEQSKGNYVMLDSASINGNFLVSMDAKLPGGMQVPYILTCKEMVAMLEGNGAKVLTPKPDGEESAAVAGGARGSVITVQP